MDKVLLTGSEGFIGGYVVKELLNRGYFVYGIDNLSKYGSIIRNHSDDKNFEFVEKKTAHMVTSHDMLKINWAAPFENLQILSQNYQNLFQK